jgi:hypothetical protein
MTYKSNDLYQLLNLACYKHTGRFLPADEEQENRWKYIITDEKKLAVQPSPTANWFKPSFFNDFSQQVNRRIITDSIKHLFKIPKYTTEILPNLGKKLRSKWKDVEIYDGLYSIMSLPIGGSKIDVNFTRDTIAKINAELSCDFHDVGLTETDREFMKDIMEFYKLTRDKYKYGFLKKEDYKIYREFFRKYDETRDDIITWEEFRKIPATAERILNGMPNCRGGNKVEYISSGSIDNKLQQRRFKKCAEFMDSENCFVQSGVVGSAGMFHFTKYNWNELIGKMFLTKSGTFRKRPDCLIYEWFEKVFLYNLSNNTYASEDIGNYGIDLPNDDPNNRVYQPHNSRANYHGHYRYRCIIGEVLNRSLGSSYILDNDNKKLRKQGWKYACRGNEFTMSELTSIFHKTDGRYEALIRRLSHQ